MKKLLYSLLLTISLLQIATKACGQDQHFSQFFNTPLFLNPAYSGSFHPIEAHVNHRRQWASLSVPFVTYMASVSMRINEQQRGKKGHWGAGVFAYNDVGGDGSLRINSICASLVYHVKVAKYQHLGLGLQTGLGSRSIDFSRFQWGSQYQGVSFNPNLPIGETDMVDASRYLDMGVGAQYSYSNTSGKIKVTGNNFKRIHGGIAFHHLNRPYYSFLGSQDRLMVRMTATGNALWSFDGSQLAIQPGFLFNRQGPHSEFVVGSSIRYEMIRDSKYTGIFGGTGVYIGTYYRAGDAFIISGAVEVGSYHIGISYDLTTSELTLSNSGRGGMELCLRYTERPSKRVVNVKL
jgi:type IX secretion system PorP/SprF family membrane protein